MLDDCIDTSKGTAFTFDCQSWLTFEQFMGSCNHIYGNMTVDFVLISNPENMPELRAVNCGH